MRHHDSGVRALAAAACLAALVALGGCGGGDRSVCAGSQPCVHYVTPPAVGGNGAGDDGSVAQASDMARSTPLDLGGKADAGAPVGDLATVAADLAPACVPTGGDCSGHNDAVCCSKYCVYATNSCR